MILTKNGCDECSNVFKSKFGYNKLWTSVRIYIIFNWQFLQGMKTNQSGEHNLLNKFVCFWLFGKCHLGIFCQVATGDSLNPQTHN